MSTKIHMSDVTVSGKTVNVSGAGATALLNSLVQKNAVTMAEITHALGFVAPEDISVGPNGVVHIANEQVAAKVSALATSKASSGILDTNCNCR